MRSAVAVVTVLVVAVAVVGAWLGVRDQVHLSAQGGALSAAFVPTSEVDLDERLPYGVPDGVATMVAVDAAPGRVLLRTAPPRVLRRGAGPSVRRAPG